MRLVGKGEEGKVGMMRLMMSGRRAGMMTRCGRMADSTDLVAVVVHDCITGDRRKGAQNPYTA